MNHLYQYTGPKHHYYVNGRLYGIAIQQTWLFKRVKVCIPEGYEGRPAASSNITYKNYGAFRREWRRT